MSLALDRSNRARRRRDRADRLFKVLCFAATGFGLVVLVLLLGKLFFDGLGRISWDFIRGMPSFRPERSGIWSAIVGSLAVLALTALFAVPIGVAAAVYLEEFTVRKNKFVEFIQLNIANLAGVPSIVYGLLGMAVFARWLALEQSILTGALTMSLLILPMVIIVSQEALRAVPKSYREGALALGCTRWQMIRKQVLPCAFSGILTGIILSVSRAIGETAPLIAVGAAGAITFVPTKLSDNYTVLPIQIFNWVQHPNPGFRSAAAAAIVVLMVVLLLLNSTAIYLRYRSQKRY